jgi:quinol monooxygenase YgiN
MIVIAGSVRVRADARDEAIRAALAMATATQAEPGCRAYRFSADLADPTLFYIHEEWDSPEALQAHFATPHMATFRAVLPRIVAGPPAITRYEVTSSAPMA